MNTSIVFEAVNVKKFSQEDLERICAIERDMWARDEGRWEYIRCNHCWHVMSKQDVFWHESKQIYALMVSEIEKILWFTWMSCSSCHSNQTSFFYPEDTYIQSLIARYQRETFAIIARKESWEIIGFVDGYVDTLDTVFDVELKDHYGDIWIDELKNAIRRKIWIIPEKIFSCSSLWTIEEFMSMPIIFSLLSKFFLSIPDEYSKLYWISELNYWWTLHAMYSALWAQELWFRWDPRLTNLGESYNSDVFLQEKLIENYRSEFSSWIRDFIKKYGKKIRDVKGVI